MHLSSPGELEGQTRMKSNEFVSEGFWDTVKKGMEAGQEAIGNHALKHANAYAGIARGLGAHDLEHTLGHHANHQFNKKRYDKFQQDAIDARASNTQVKPNPARASNQPSSPVEVSGALQPGEKFEIINPKTNTVYYKTTQGWFNPLGQPIRDPASISALEKYSEQQRGRLVVTPTAQQSPVLSRKQLAQQELSAARRAAFQPKPMTNPPVYNKQRRTTQGVSEMNESVKKAQKLINEYTVKEMAVRRLKKEKQLQEATKGKKSTVDTPRTGKEEKLNEN